jgi:hypothetical protein
MNPFLLTTAVLLVVAVAAALYEPPDIGFGY